LTVPAILFLILEKSNIIIRLEGIGSERTVSLSSNGSLFTVGSDVTLILDNNITLKGRSNNITSLVFVDSGGALEMKTGAKITGNTYFGISSYGGGVYVRNSGTFTMRGGEILGNTSSYSSSYSDPYSYNYVFSYGGGVYLDGGTFTMSNGKISGNTSHSSYYSSLRENYVYSYGGGVYLNGGTFTMSGGEISGNTSSSDYSSYGGGVYVGDNGIFTKIGGTVYGYTASDSNSNVVVLYMSGYVYNNSGHAAYVNSSMVKRRESTAGPTVNMDSAVAGTAGGWE